MWGFQDTLQKVRDGCMTVWFFCEFKNLIC